MHDVAERSVTIVSAPRVPAPSQIADPGRAAETCNPDDEAGPHPKVRPR